MGKSSKLSMYSKKFVVKLMKRRVKPLNVHNFQEGEFFNFIIYDEDGNKIKKFSGKISRSKVKKISNKYDNAKIMVNISNGYFKLISISSFIKLTSIKSIGFTKECFVLVDGDDEYESFNNSDLVISSISQLINVLMKDYIYDSALIQSQGGMNWYNCFMNEYIIVVQTKDDEYVKYKSLDKFLNEYGLSKSIIL